MPFYERGNARIHYQEADSGFPLFIICGGGLNSRVTYRNGPFDAVAEFKSEYRCITMDLRNANGGESDELRALRRARVNPHPGSPASLFPR